MRKSKTTPLTAEEIERIVSLAQEERHPIETIKKDFGLSEQEILDLMKKNMSPQKFEAWKKKAQTAKARPKPIKIDDFDEDLDGKYYIKNKFD